MLHLQQYHVKLHDKHVCHLLEALYACESEVSMTDCYCHFSLCQRLSRLKVTVTLSLEDSPAVLLVLPVAAMG